MARRKNTEKKYKVVKSLPTDAKLAQEYAKEIWSDYSQPYPCFLVAYKKGTHPMVQGIEIVVFQNKNYVTFK